jgi:hypothetical protein
MKTKLIVLLLLLIATIGYSQVNFKPGYIVLKSGDTLNTRISYLGGSQMYEGVCFVQINGEISCLPAKNVVMYKRDSVEYRAFTNSRGKQSFFKLIQTGCIDLYVYQYCLTTVYVYNGGGTNLTNDLDLEYVLFRSNRYSTVITSENYQNIVAGYIVDDNEVYNKFNEDLKFQNVEAVIRFYNTKHSNK